MENADVKEKASLLQNMCISELDQLLPAECIHLKAFLKEITFYEEEEIKAKIKKAF